jgi:hypothetical protein
MTDTTRLTGDDLEPYCAACGATAGIFQGRGPAWHHFRGRGTPGDPVELYDAGHDPVVAWRGPEAAAQVTEADHG